MKELVLKSINLSNSVKHNFNFAFGRYGSIEETMENIIFTLLKYAFVLQFCI